MEQENNEITYDQLSWPLKAAVVMAWIVGVLYMLAFIGGMVTGLY